MNFFKGWRAHIPLPPRQHIQVLSDLHLEVGQQYTTYTFPVSARILLLAGDIGRLIDYDNYLRFLQVQVSRYHIVLLVLGNHEFYGLTYEAGLEHAARLASEPSLAQKFVLLHRSRWDDASSNVTILGCTLWSNIPKDAYNIVDYKISDFRKISEWTPQKHSQVHADEVAWLRDQVAVCLEQGRRIVVATHHAPCVEGTSKPEHTANPWTCAFSTALINEDAVWSRVKAWIFGHTHYSTSFTRKGIRLVSNQRGYVFPNGVAEDGNAGKKKKGINDFDAARSVAV